MLSRSRTCVRSPRAVRRSTGELGSALVLFPAGLLIFLMLAGITVDYARAFMAQRELANAAAAAANDGAAMLGPRGFYDGGVPAVDPERAALAAAAARSARAASSNVVMITRFEPHVAPDAVRVEAEGYVGTIFFRAFPWGPRTIRVRASGVATAWELTP